MSGLEQFTQALIAARQTGTILPNPSPADGPQTLDEGYAVQDAVLAACGPIGGWKVSPLTATASPMYGGIPASDIAPLEAASLASLVGCEVEVEIGFRLGRDLPGTGTAYAIEDVVGAIAAALPCIELLGSRFESRKAVTKWQATADSLNNLRILFGAPLVDWHHAALFDAPLTLDFGAERVGSAHGNATMEQVLGAVACLANHAVDHGTPLKAGQIIITGARLGPIILPSAVPVRAEIAGLSPLIVAA